MTAAPQLSTDPGHVGTIRRAHGDLVKARLLFLEGHAHLHAFYLEGESGNAVQLCLLHLHLPENILGDADHGAAAVQVKFHDFHDRTLHFQPAQALDVKHIPVDPGVGERMLPLELCHDLVGTGSGVFVLEAARIRGDAGVDAGCHGIGQRHAQCLDDLIQHLAGSRSIRIHTDPVCIVRIGNVVVDAKIHMPLIGAPQIPQQLQIRHIHPDHILCREFTAVRGSEEAVPCRNRLGTQHLCPLAHGMQQLHQGKPCPHAVPVRTLMNEDIHILALFQAFCRLGDLYPHTCFPFPVILPDPAASG